jgi:hypothetical protein
VLVEKYRVRDFEAKAMCDFLLPMLRWEPKDRKPAHELLNHYWFKMIPNYGTTVSKRELREFK